MVFLFGHSKTHRLAADVFPFNCCNWRITGRRRFVSSGTFSESLSTSSSEDVTYGLIQIDKRWNIVAVGEFKPCCGCLNCPIVAIGSMCWLCGGLLRLSLVIANASWTNKVVHYHILQGLSVVLVVLVVPVVPVVPEGIVWASSVLVVPSLILGLLFFRRLFLVARMPYTSTISMKPHSMCRASWCIPSHRVAEGCRGNTEVNLTQTRDSVIMFFGLQRRGSRL